MSGPYSNATTQGGIIPLPSAGLQASIVTFRLFVDRSLLEVRHCCLCAHIECLWQADSHSSAVHHSVSRPECSLDVTSPKHSNLESGSALVQGQGVHVLLQGQRPTLRLIIKCREGSAVRVDSRCTVCSLCLRCAQVYALQGRGRVSSRIYPLGLSNQWGLSAYGAFGSLPASVNLTAWDMGNAFNDTRSYICC